MSPDFVVTVDDKGHATERAMASVFDERSTSATGALKQIVGA
jgi:hypothetical protein